MGTSGTGVCLRKRGEAFTAGAGRQAEPWGRGGGRARPPGEGFACPRAEVTGPAKSVFMSPPGGGLMHLSACPRHSAAPSGSGAVPGSGDRTCVPACQNLRPDGRTRQSERRGHCGKGTSLPPC